MKQKQSLLVVISLVLVVSLLATDVFYAFAAPQHLTVQQRLYKTKSGTQADDGDYPSMPVPNSPAPSSNVHIIDEGPTVGPALPFYDDRLAPQKVAEQIWTSTATNGRILFAPAIDTDGDPSSNPTANHLVPTLELYGQPGGFIQLAIQLEAAEAQAAVLHVPVTFRVWNDEGLFHERVVETDEWGAAQLNVPVRFADTAFYYQAAAAGFGTTEQRTFRLDLNQVSIRLNEEEAHLSYQLLEDNWIQVHVTSRLPLNAETDSASLTLVRRPLLDTVTDIYDDVRLQLPEYDTLAKVNAQIPSADMPKVLLEITDAHTARARVQLPAGEYGMTAMLIIDNGTIDYFSTNAEHVVIEQPLVLSDNPTEVIAVSEFPVEPNQYLVTYDGDYGFARFGLVTEEEVANLSMGWADSSELVNIWRTGPYEWYEEHYQVDIEKIVDDGLKEVVLQNFEYDPLNQQYTIAIKSKHTEVITDMLRIDVMGPGGIVILHEDSQVVLRPDDTILYTIDVPAELGRPQGLRVTLDDPLIEDITAAASALKQLYNAASVEGSATAYVQAYLELLGIPLVEAQMNLPGMDLQIETPLIDQLLADPWGTLIRLVDGFLGGINFLRVGWGRLVWNIITGQYSNLEWEELLGEVDKLVNVLSIELGAAGVAIGEEVSVKFTVDDGACPDPDARAQIEQQLERLAIQLNSQFSQQLVNTGINLSRNVRVPIFGPVAFRGLRLQIRASGEIKKDAGLSLKLEGKGDIGLQSRLMFSFDFGFISTLKSLFNLDFSNENLQTIGWFVAASKFRSFTQMILTIQNYLQMIDAATNISVAQDDCDPDPPDPRPPDDRQDIWQAVDHFYQGDNDAETAERLHQYIQQAQALGLWRAERLLTWRLREIEQKQLLHDTNAYVSYMEGSFDAMRAADQDIINIISGTVQLTSTEAISVALLSRMTQAWQEMDELPYVQQQQRVADALDIASQEYLALLGEELELQHELRQLFIGDAVGVLASGFAEATLLAMEQAGLPAQLVSPWPGNGEFRGRPAPYLAPGLAPRAIIVPSGGLHMIAGSPEAQAWLEAYVAGGGTLVAFTQAFGSDWAALPGSQVNGIGYEEEQRWQTASVESVARSKWLVWMGVQHPSIQVDGAFTSWPANATILLKHRQGLLAGFPVMLEYGYGEGSVLATSVYGDWALQAGFWWGDDWQLTRTVLIRAYLLAQGKDVEDVATGNPEQLIAVSVPLTNTSAYMATSATIHIPLLAEYSNPSRVSVPLALGPGEGTVLNINIPAPPARRRVPGWTQTGLYHLKIDVVTRGNRYATWGPFIHVQSPIDPPDLYTTISAAPSSAGLFQTVDVQASIVNFRDITRTVVLSTGKDLPLEQVTITVPPEGEANYVFPMVMDRSKTAVVTFINESDVVMSREQRLVNLVLPSLRARPELPAELVAGAPFTMTVSNRSPYRWQTVGGAFGASIAMTLTNPSGTPVWATTEALSPILSEETRSFVFTPTIPFVELGRYTLAYRLDNGLRTVQQGYVTIPAQATLWVEPNPVQDNRVREPLAITANVLNNGRFRLTPVIELVIPDLGVAYSQTVTIPAAAQWTETFTYTLPDDLPHGNHSILLQLHQGSTIAQSATFALPDAHLVSSVVDQTYTAGTAVPVTLVNNGGIDTVITYTLGLVGEGDLEQGAGSIFIEAGSTAVVTGVIPLATASDSYDVVVQGRYADGRKIIHTIHPITVSGSDVQALPESTLYTAGDDVPVTLINHGQVDAFVFYALYLRDQDSDLLLSFDADVLVPALSSVVVTGTVPEGTRGGRYGLYVEGSYTPGDREIDAVSLVTIAGTEVDIVAYTDRELYLTIDTITTTGDLTSSGTPLPGGEMELAIVREKPGRIQAWHTYNTANSPLSYDVVTAVAADADNNVWMASSLGYYGAPAIDRLLADQQTWEHYGWPETISYAMEVREIAIDSTGQVWFASDAGVVKLSTDLSTWTIYQSSSSGLVSNDVTAVAVDAQDNVWFGTSSGVSILALDGSWTTYDSANSGLASDWVYALAFTTDGSAWIGTDAGLNQLATDGTWTTYNEANSDILLDYVVDIAVDQNSDLWLITPGYQGGVSVLHPDDTWTTYTPYNSGLYTEYVTTVAIDADGRKWIGSDYDGLDVLSANLIEWEHHYPPTIGDYMINDIATAPNGDVWLGTGGNGEGGYGMGGVTRAYWTDQGFEVYNTYNSGISHDNVLAIETDRLDNVWLATLDYWDEVGATANYFTPNTDHWLEVYFPEGMYVWDVHDIFSDANGRTWFSTNDGLGVLAPDHNSWTVYQEGNGLNSQTVYGVVVDDDGNAWIATEYGGVNQLTAAGSWITYTTSNSDLLSDQVLAVDIDNAGNLWFGTDSGLNRYTPASNTWVSYTEATGDLPSDWIVDIAIDQDGNVWLARDGWDGGVSVLHTDNSWTHYDPDNSGLTTPYLSSIVVDADGRKWIGSQWLGVDVLSADNTTWTHYAYPPLSGNNVRDMAAAKNGEVWLATEYQDGGGCEECDFASLVTEFDFEGGATRAYRPLDTEEVLWRHVVTVTLGSPDTYTEVESLLAGSLNATGRLTLRGFITNTLGQRLDEDRDPFYIFPTLIGLTLETDREQYQTDEAMVISGILANHSATTLLNQTVVVTLNGDMVYASAPFDLNPGQTFPYSFVTNAPSEAGQASLQAISPQVQVYHSVPVIPPRGEAVLTAPGVAGRGPFSATVTIDNTGIDDAIIEVTLAGHESEWLILRAGEQTQIARSFTIRTDTLITATVRGDLHFDLQQEVLWGENAELDLLPPESVIFGPVAVPYLITGTGQVATPVNLVYQLDAGETVTESTVVLPGQVVAGVLVIDATYGRHELTGDLLDVDGRQLDQDAEEFTLLAAGEPQEPSVRLLSVTPDPSPVPAGDVVSVTLTIANDGPPGPALVGLQLFDPLQQWIVSLDGWLTQTVTFPLAVPADMPADSYFGEGMLNEQSRPFTVDVLGVDIEMSLALDRPYYYPGDPALLTVTLTDTAGLTDDYIVMSRYITQEDYVTVTVPANTAVQYVFPFTATETNRANVFLSHTPSPEAGQRVLMLDSIPVPVVDPSGGVYLTFDKLVYDPGETVHMTVHVTGTVGFANVMGPMELTLIADDFLAWSGPMDEVFPRVVTGTYALSYTLPMDIRMGQYTFMLTADGDVTAYPIDVRGWKVTTRHIGLDKSHYDQQDEMTAVVEFWNEGETPIYDLPVKTWIFTPDDGEVFALGTLTRTVDLEVGLNVITVTGQLSTPVVGPHRLVVNLTSPGAAWRVSGGATQFDVGWAHLVELTTDQGNYAPGEPGVGRLDVVGYGPTQLAVTASDGSTLLDTQVTLQGFATYTFTIPTTDEGDYLLVATSVDQNGASDRLLRAYAVPTPRDTQPPQISLTNPHTYTILLSSAPTLTIPVQGQASDDSGQVTVLVNGDLVTPTVSGVFTTEVVLVQGINLISAVAIDPEDNVAFTPLVPVLLLPDHNSTLTANTTEAHVGQTITFTLNLTAAGTLSDVMASLILPTGMLTDVIATANTGAIVLDQDDDYYGATWEGDVLPGVLVDILVTGQLLTEGTFTAAASTHWGVGVIDRHSVNITVLPLNRRPVAVDDPITTDEDNTIVIDVLANDTDPDGDPLRVISITAPLNGMARVNLNNSITYTPTANFWGSDTFAYTVSDGRNGYDQAVVTMTVLSVNDAPLAVPDVAQANGVAPITIDVLANDSDVDGDTLTVLAVTQPVSGSVVINPDDTLTYTPAGELTAPDTFSYEVGDGHGGVAATVVTIQPAPAQAPSTDVGTYAVLATNSAWLRDGSQLHSGHVGVMNASPGPVLQGNAELVIGLGTVFRQSASQIAADTVKLEATSVVFDLFHNELTAAPNAAHGALITPLMLPLPVNLPPFREAIPGEIDITLAQNETRTLAAGQYRDIVLNKNSVLTLSGGVYHVASLDMGNFAQLLVTGPTELRIAGRLGDGYTAIIGPAAGSGLDGSDFIIHVGGINGESGGLTAHPFAAEVGKFNTLRATIYAPNGTLLLNYGTQAHGAYLAKDVWVDTNSQIWLESGFAAGNNRVPAAVADVTITQMGTAVTIAVLTNDGDLDGDEISLLAVGQPSQGTAVQNPDGTITYTPVPGFYGVDSFTYTIGDSNGNTAVATVTVNIPPASSSVTISDFVVLGAEGVSLERGSTVTSGHIGVNDASDGPNLVGNQEMTVGMGSVLAADSWILADTVYIEEQAVVADVFFAEISGAGAAGAVHHTPVNLPLVSAFPDVPVFAPGSNDVNVLANQTHTLAPGSYRNLTVGKSATVILTGGVYNFASWNVDSYVNLLVLAPTEIRVAGKLKTGNFTYLGPATSAPDVTAADIVLFVTGQNGTQGAIDETVKAASFGIKGTVIANVYVPDGTLVLGKGSNNRGAFFGKWVIVGIHTAVALESGW